MHRLESRVLFSGNGTGLTATYFNDLNFSGDTVTRTDAAVDFAWGTGSPAAGISPYTYSVRWTGRVQPKYSEMYTFYATGNDGVRLWVNGRVLVDDWTDQASNVTQGQIALQAGAEYAITVEYFQDGGSAQAKLEWSSPSQVRQVVPTSQLYPGTDAARAGAGTGLTGTYFSQPNFSGTAITQSNETLDFDWEKGTPLTGIDSESFSARWVGKVQPMFSETYTFHTTADDALRLWLNGKLLVDDFSSEPGVTWGSAKASDVLGISGSETGLWFGQAVRGDDFVTMQTYAGDANLDGTLNVDDYGQIDGGISARLSGWYHGDFNADGVINVDDYGAIDANIARQGEPFVSGAGRTTAMPNSPRLSSAAIALTGGVKYDIVVEYLEAHGDASARLEWSSSSQQREVIPAAQLYSSSPPPAPPASVPGSWHMIFNDEFSGTALDPVWHATQYWEHEYTVVGQGELQAYDASAALVRDGRLHLTARKDSSYGVPYVSGLVQTGGDTWVSGEPKFNFTYGYMEVRAKLPSGQGLWPAVWMMPASHNDDNGELDVLEVIGSDPTRANFNLHRNGLNDGHEWVGPDFSKDYHTFGVDWQAGYVAWYVDGVERARTTDPRYISPEASYPILNVAVGGDWPGAPDATTQFPATMEVDYVRVWQRAG